MSSLERHRTFTVRVKATCRALCYQSLMHNCRAFKSRLGRAMTSPYANSIRLASEVERAVAETVMARDDIR
jgi:hypothetical protein